MYRKQYMLHNFWYVQQKPLANAKLKWISLASTGAHLYLQKSYPTLFQASLRDMSNFVNLSA